MPLPMNDDIGMSASNRRIVAYQEILRRPEPDLEQVLAEDEMYCRELEETLEGHRRQRSSPIAIAQVETELRERRAGAAYMRLLLRVGRFDVKIVNEPVKAEKVVAK